MGCGPPGGGGVRDVRVRVAYGFCAFLARYAWFVDFFILPCDALELGGVVWVWLWVECRACSKEAGSMICFTYDEVCCRD